MASNPLVEALDHFSLSQLMSDTGLCRNVLNDVGASPAEVFLLVAALEARVPQTLLEYSATNDLPVVEPRLVDELNQRGIERDRATWAVNSWKEAVGGSSLGQQTIIRQTEPVVVTGGSAPGPGQGPPPGSASQPTTVPQRPAQKRRGGLIAAIIAVVLVAAGLITWAVWPDDKHAATATPPSTSGSSSISSTASSTASLSARSSTAASTASSSPTTSGSATTNNRLAQLGPAQARVVPGTVLWSDTYLQVKQGHRIRVTATGRVAHAPGKYNGPNGAPDPKLDIYSLIRGAPHAALIGRIGRNGAPFLVGAKYDNLAGASGELYLGVNDYGRHNNGVGNNSGQFNAVVRLQK